MDSIPSRSWATNCSTIGKAMMSGARILVVDDEQSVLDLVSASLRQEGYEVHKASDGPSDLKAARAFKPELIVLDAS